MSHYAKGTRAPVIEIVVSGRPAPQGSKRHVGGGRMLETSKHVKPWRDAVRADALLARQAWARKHGAWVALDEALAVEMVFTVAKPVSAPKRKQTWPMRTPDLSKLARSTEDALTDAGIWRDDARVVDYRRLAKVFPGEDPDALDAPGAVIRVYRFAVDADSGPLRSSVAPEHPSAGAPGRPEALRANKTLAKLGGAS